MEARNRRTIHLTEEMWAEIIARLPLRIIARLKSVSKTWKSTIESVYFRRLFVSVHKKSSTSWSLIWYGDKYLIDFHGCETWGLSKSLPFFIPPPLNVTEASSHGLVLVSEYGLDCYFVGNPVLRKWIKIPPAPAPAPGRSSPFGLVTRVDKDGFVLGFKVVMLAKDQATNNYVSSTLDVCLYSSETGIWTSKTIHCPYQITNYGSLTLDGTIYFNHLSEPGVLVAYDFYSASSDQFRVIPLPDHPNHGFDHDFKGALTTSQGFIMYIRTLALSSSSTVFKAWRLLNNDSSWQLVWNICLPLLIGDYVPMAMHPFDSDTVYLWSRDNRHVVSCNLGTQKKVILGDGDHQDCVLNQSVCEECMDEICDFKVSGRHLQLVLPRWMESVPCPPQVEVDEVMDTASVVAHVTAMLEIKQSQVDHWNE
ncbi:PREDICTED: F-box protein At3g26010-like [Camelina sativa]|uniref:F-box protein At3g26010-like n=1 Tax=Camelina sativa TaxID=90675 RepID=A0ABM0TEP4_CAMSA|nr:PREDICTED: F-box protein At3g26010-like [Camelina sativa]